ncbi:MAG: NADH-quinone oxidoreductase subunit N [Chloroflexi bacterium]|nr:NADH-quinone oxidoreductase subunit N [Chloroflexota bacterium]
MPPINWPEVLNLLSPELILTTFAVLVLGLDLIWGRGGDRTAYVALLGLGVAIIASLRLLGANQEILFGMVAVDSFAIFFKVIAALTTALVILSSMEFMKRKTPYRGEFYGLLLLGTVAMNLLAAASDLIMIFLALEFVSQTSYVLTGFLRKDYASSEGGIKYLLYGALTTALTLYGLSLLYGATGATNLREIALSLASPDSPIAGERWLLLPALVFALTGFAFKISLVPFHQWTPDAYEGAPTPIAAFLSVGPKAMGFAVLIRFLITALPGTFQPDWVALLSAISIVTMTFGNLVAIQQENIKRMLAYSSISQVGYILLGVVALGSGSIGEQGVLIYILAYLFTNLGAFIAVVAFSHVTASDNIRDYAGLIRRAPILAFSLVVFFMSLAGIPPTGGFLGKLFVFGAAIQQGFYFLAIVGVVNSVISLYYYFGIVRQMFFLPAKSSESLPIPRSLVLGLAITLVMTLIMGLYPQPFIDLAVSSAQITPTLP